MQINSVKNRAVSARSSHGLRMAPARRAYGLWSYDFLKHCKNADYYKIVEATEIVERRRVAGAS